MDDVGNVDQLHAEHGRRFFYNHDRIAAVVNTAYDTGSSQRSSLKTTEYQGKGWNPRAEDFDLDEAPFPRG
jgi:hypothetical protein